MAERSKQRPNIVYLLLALLLLVCSFKFIKDFLYVAVLIVFLPIIVIYLKEEGFYGKYSTPNAIKDWEKFQKERRPKAPKYTRKSPNLAINPILAVPLTFILCFLLPKVEPPIIVSVAVSMVFLALGLIALQQKRIIDDTPTLKTIGAFIGQVELQGTAESANPLTSHITGTKCVYYSWEKVEQSGTTGWVVTSSGERSSVFYLKDDTGAIRIDPDGALLIPDSSNKVMNTQNDPYAGELKETLIPLHSPLYVIGHAKERKDQVAVEIVYDEKNPLFVISTHKEKEVSQKYRNQFIVLALVGFFCSLIIPRLSADPTVREHSGLSPLLTASQSHYLFLPTVIFMAALILGWFFAVYNSLINLHNNVEQAWSTIDVQLKRRSDLIPNLVKLIEGYKSHEQYIQKQILTLRAQSLNQEKLEGVTSIIYSLAEAYPELKAGQRFLELQHALEETEQRIALARDYYNHQTRFYNTRLDVLPDLIIARIGGLKPRKYWVAENFNRPTEKIDFVS